MLDSIEAERADGGMTAALDDLVQPGPELLRVSGQLANQVAVAFGVPELEQITPQGQFMPVIGIRPLMDRKS
jgi:hypothetical protein